MKLELASLNFKNSSISERERLAFSGEEIRRIIHEIKKGNFIYIFSLFQFYFI